MIDKRTAQISQIFLMITALLVIGGTIFLGGKLIGGITGTACSANDATFFKNIVEIIDDKSSYGSRDIVSIKTPCDAINLCFVDGTKIGKSTFDGKDSTIKTSVTQGVPTTVFLQDHSGVMVPVGDEPRIEVVAADDTVLNEELCIPAVGGEFAFRTEGYGRKIRISK
jgi:hypothetical protein